MHAYLYAFFTAKSGDAMRPATLADAAVKDKRPE